MVLDHIDHIPGLLPAELSGLFHVLTRCVGTFFAYLAVEGFVHTHSRPRYALRRATRCITRLPTTRGCI